MLPRRPLNGVREIRQGRGRSLGHDIRQRPRLSWILPLSLFHWKSGSWAFILMYLSVTSSFWHFKALPVYPRVVFQKRSQVQTIRNKNKQNLGEGYIEMKTWGVEWGIVSTTKVDIPWYNVKCRRKEVNYKSVFISEMRVRLENPWRKAETWSVPFKEPRSP